MSRGKSDSAERTSIVRDPDTGVPGGHTEITVFLPDRDVAHGRMVIWRRPAEQEIASLRQLRRDLSADVVSQYLMQRHEPLSSFGPAH